MGMCSLQTFSMLRDGQISLSMPILKTPMQNSHLSHIIQVKTTYTLRNYQLWNFKLIRIWLRRRPRNMARSSRGQNPHRVKMTKAKHVFFLSRQLTSSRHSCRTRRFYNECICKPWFYLNVTLPNLKIAMAVYNYQLKNTNLNLT